MQTKNIVWKLVLLTTLLLYSICVKGETSYLADEQGSFYVFNADQQNEVNLFQNPPIDFWVELIGEQFSFNSTTNKIPILLKVGSNKLNNLATNGHVEIRIVKMNLLQFTYSNSAKTLNGKKLSNSDWKYEGGHPSYHRFIYKGSAKKLINQFIGIHAVFDDSIQGRGKFGLKVALVTKNINELDKENNSDTKTIHYFF